MPFDGAQAAFVPQAVLDRLDAVETRLDALEAANALRAREIAGVRRRLTRLENHLDVTKVTVEITAPDLGTIVDVDLAEHDLAEGSQYELHPAVAQVLVDGDVARYVEGVRS